MKFLTVAAAIFASTSLAVPTNNHNGGGGCVPRPDPGNSNTGSAPGGSPTSSHTSSVSGPGTKPTSGNTSSSPATKPTDGNTGSSPGPKPTGSHTSSGPGTKPTDGHTSSSPGPKPTGSHTSSGPGPKPTGSHTSSVPATTTTGSNTDSHTSSGPSTTSTGHPGSGGGDYCPAVLYSNPQCCATDVLGLVDLSCFPPRRTPTSGEDFRSICAEVGQKAQCCVIPVAGQAVLCSDPIGGHPTSVPGGHPTSIPGSHPTSVPGGHPTSIPGGHPTSIPGGHPTSIPGSHPTSVPGHPTAPSDGNDPITFCPKGLYSNLQCCATDVLGVTDINCSNPEHTPTYAKSFQSICAAVGKQARCCVIPVAGQAVLCSDPIPPVGHPTSVPVGHPTSVPGGNPTSAPGGNPTPVPGHPTPPSGGNPTPVPGHPTPPSGGNKPCPPGLYGNPQCCATDLLGLAILNCDTPKHTPTSANSFKRICAADGQQAMCCVIPIAGQAVLCQKPPDV